MKPQHQLFRHRPDEGQIGDCWRTVIACLLNMPAADVPHFVQTCWNESATATARLRAWLASVGYGYVEMAYTGTGALQSILDSIADCNPNTYYLLGGNSKTGCGHCVIGLNDQVAWDPSPDAVGITGPMDDGYYWIGFLVPASQVVSKAPPAAVQEWLDSIVQGEAA